MTLTFNENHSKGSGEQSRHESVKVEMSDIRRALIQLVYRSRITYMQIPTRLHGILQAEHITNQSVNGNGIMQLSKLCEYTNFPHVTIQLDNP